MSLVILDIPLLSTPLLIVFPLPSPTPLLPLPSVLPSVLPLLLSVFLVIIPPYQLLDLVSYTGLL